MAKRGFRVWRKHEGERVFLAYAHGSGWFDEDMRGCCEMFDTRKEAEEAAEEEGGGTVLAVVRFTKAETRARREARGAAAALTAAHAAVNEYRENRMRQVGSDDTIQEAEFDGVDAALSIIGVALADARRRAG